jgi:hypothetical protein
MVPLPASILLLSCWKSLHPFFILINDWPNTNNKDLQEYLLEENSMRLFEKKVRLSAKFYILSY